MFKNTIFVDTAWRSIQYGGAVPVGNPINLLGNARFQELHNTVIFFRGIAVEATNLGEIVIGKILYQIWRVIYSLSK